MLRSRVTQNTSFADIDSVLCAGDAYRRYKSDLSMQMDLKRHHV